MMGRAFESLRHPAGWPAWLGIALCAALLGWSHTAAAASGAELEQDARAALEQLYEKQPETRFLAEQSSAVLVFPRILKAGLVVGAERGKGVLFRDDKPDGHYASTGLSYGLQAGAQAYGYALFFMRESATRALDDRNGWEIGVGPSVVLIDEGAARKLSSTTADHDIYAYVFGQKGLMAGIGVQGSKITKLD
ncbi:lipid-binding SYLF domain-containing protein [Castellaniella sp. S9]|uniref:lipid-binding SYLF domain-containing protein n=1 Tax=Castellaniella sp. S9 TaxID=2993652 RepID=UPI0022B42BFD|nr:lipid-binding SYLF domain-containing protein [Castellaniella sp. S9]